MIQPKNEYVYNMAKTFCYEELLGKNQNFDRTVCGGGPPRAEHRYSQTSKEDAMMGHGHCNPLHLHYHP